MLEWFALVLFFSKTVVNDFCSCSCAFQCLIRRPRVEECIIVLKQVPISGTCLKLNLTRVKVSSRDSSVLDAGITLVCLVF